MKDVFDEIETAIDNVADETEEKKADKEKREKSKFYIIPSAIFVANSQKELREYLEENDDIVRTHKIVKGIEVQAKRKVAYVF